MFKLNLRSKIFWSYMFLIFLLALVSFQAIRSLMTLQDISDKLVRENYKSIFAAQNMMKTLERHKSGVWMVVAGKKKEADKIFSESKEEFLKRLEDAKVNATLEGESELIKEIEDNYMQFTDLYQWLEKYTESRDSVKIEFYTRAIRWKLDRLSQQTLSLMEKNRQAMFEKSKQARDLSNQFSGVMIIFSIIGVVMGLGASIGITNLIVGPIEHLTKAVAEIRKGNYDIYVKTDYSDEIGILSTEFNKMAKQLKIYKQLDLKKIMHEKLRTEAILRSVGDSMIVIDTDYKIIMVNPTAERIFYLIPGLSQGRHIQNILRSDTLFEIIKMEVEKKSPPGSMPIFEWEYDRIRRHFQVKVFPVKTQDGPPNAYIILFEDVTKFKELDQMKSDFISIASHELRTPMTSIIMSLGMVLNGSAGEMNEDQKDLLGVAYEDATRLRQMMNNLLDVSRMEAGAELEFMPVEPKKILEDVQNSFNSQAQSKNVEIKVDVPEDTPKVLADYHKIIQVFNNLLGNALRYTPENGTISMSVKPLNGNVQFTVADTGTGIPKEYHRKIFQKFVQVANDKTPGAAGLGLALVNEIIKAHHGNIWMESEINRGSKFHFTLPTASEIIKK